MAACPTALRIVLIAVALVAVGATATAHAQTMRLGFLDGNFANPSVQAEFLGDAKDLGSTVARVPSGWSGIAPTRPANPTDPADPAYRWTQTDAAVRATVSAGMEPLLSLTSAPAWAEGPDRPSLSIARNGTWRPDIKAYGEFGRALGRRYDGTYPDPLRPGRTLPRVRVFIPWNEPNLTLYLAPQWARQNGRAVPEAPRHYRALVRSFHSGIHAAQSKAIVVAGALAPFGDNVAGSTRLPPARFLREMLCLDSKLRRNSCGNGGNPRFDAFSHHPYSVRGPFSGALNKDDVTVPDIKAKLTRPLRRAESLGLLGSKRARPMWVTEMSWDSRPDPDGLSTQRHAEWLAESLYVLARQGIRTITWYQVRDQAKGTAWNVTSQSGVIYVDGRAKPAARAFRFPVVARRSSKGTTLWAVAPGKGRLTFERRSGSRWVTVARVDKLAHGRIVTRRVKNLRAGMKIRARQGDERSLTVTVRTGT
jgi:hypothetical protein